MSTSVAVELRTWRKDEEAGGLTAVGLVAVLAGREGGIALTERSTGRLLGPEEVRGVLAVREMPSPKQALLLAAVAVEGFPVEPRVAGDVWDEELPVLRKQEGP